MENEKPQRLNLPRTMLVGMAFLTIMALWQLYDQVIPLMLKNTFGMGDFTTGAVMALDNILALFLLPLFGTLSDRTRMRLGRRIPYILVGTLLAAGFTAALPFADRAGNLPLFLAVLLGLLLSMAIYRSPAVALMPDVTPKPLRARGNAIINLMGAFGGMIALALIGVLVPEIAGQRADYRAVFLAVAGLMLLALLVLMLTIRERRLVREMQAINYGVDRYAEEVAQVDNTGRERLSPPLRRSLMLILCSVALWYMGYNAVTSAYSRYAQAVWGQGVGNSSLSLLVANGGAIVSFVPVGWLAGRIGRKRMICFGTLLLALTFAAITLFTSFTPALYALFALVGCAWACINVNSYPMVVDLSRGPSVGRYTGYYYAFSMAAQILTPILSGYLLQHVGYWTLFPYAALCVVLSFVTMLFVRHGDGER